jgi:hypothetical protein
MHEAALHNNAHESRSQGKKKCGIIHVADGQSERHYCHFKIEISFITITRLFFIALKVDFYGSSLLNLMYRERG